MGASKGQKNFNCLQEFDYLQESIDGSYGQTVSLSVVFLLFWKVYDTEFYPLIKRERPKVRHAKT